MVTRRLCSAVGSLVADHVGAPLSCPCVCGVHVAGLSRRPGRAGTHSANQRRRNERGGVPVTGGGRGCDLRDLARFGERFLLMGSRVATVAFDLLSRRGCVDRIERAFCRTAGGTMFRFIPPLTAALVGALATAASATPVPAITVSGEPTVGAPVTFDATATVCDAVPCGYTWRIINETRLGITFGLVPIATYTFSSAGPARIQLRVVNSNPRIGGPPPREAIIYQYTTVSPPPAS